MDGRKTGPLSRVIEAPKLVGSQRQIPRAPFHVSAGPLAHLCERCGLGLELLLCNRGQRPEHAIGLQQGGTEALGQRRQRRSSCARLRRGHTLAIQ